MTPSTTTTVGPPLRDVVCVFVGDTGVGKTCLLERYQTECFPIYISTLNCGYSAEVTVGTAKVRLHTDDTLGEDIFKPVRRLFYERADVVICCYSVADRESFGHVRSKWYDEISQYCSDIPFILCGTKGDLRRDPKVDTVTFEAAQALGKELGARKVVECSAKTGNNIKNVLDVAIRTAIKTQRSCILM